LGKLKAGFIGFIPRTAQGDEYYDWLKTYADIGYKGFEHGSGLFNGDVDANLARVKSYGIQPLVMGMMSRPGETPDMNAVVEKCHKLGVTRVPVYTSITAMYRFGGLKVPPTYDEVMAEIEEFEKKATFFKGEGIDFMFHNHDTEIATKFGGMNILQLMYVNTDNLKFELDCGWVLAGGGDPIDYINRFGDRISCLHIKDFVDGWVCNSFPGAKHKNAMPRFTTPGTGKLDLRGCLKAGCEIGLEWAIVEQDFMYNLTPKETLTAAYLNMKETGYVE
jgi:sugar phosphate isomerase/epimerase